MTSIPIYSDPIAHKAADSIREFYHLGDGAMVGKVSTLLESGDKAGIDEFVILPVAMRPDRTRHINDFIIEQVAQQHILAATACTRPQSRS